MAIESGAKLTDEEEQLIKKYFENYEFAIDVNASMRGDAVKQYSAQEVLKSGEKIKTAIETKGLITDADTVLYRAMSQQFHGEERARQLAAKDPAGARVRCLISAAETSSAALFGGGRYVYHLAIPPGERYVRRKAYSSGQGHWYEYLLPPGHVFFYGDYEDVQDGAIPAIYVLSSDLGLPDYKRLIGRAGMQFRKLSSVIPKGSEDLYKSAFPTRVMEFPWGYELTNIDDGTIRIFDINRGKQK